MSGGTSLLIEGLVCALLAATIFYCVALERRLKQLRADEQIMRRTIVDLSGATETAERSIGALKQTVAHADASLATRLESAERFAADLAMNVRAGEDIIDRVRQIVETSRRAAAAAASSPAPVAVSAAVDNAPPASRNGATRLAATALAAERLVERARARQRGEAA